MDDKDKKFIISLFFILVLVPSIFLYFGQQTRLIQVTHTIQDKYTEVRDAGYSSYTAYIFIDESNNEHKASRAIYVSKELGDTFNKTEFRWSWEIKPNDIVIQEGLDIN